MYFNKTDMNNEAYLRGLRKREAAIRALREMSDEEYEVALKKRLGCSVFAGAIREINNTYEKVNKCRVSKGLLPLENILDTQDSKGDLND